MPKNWWGQWMIEFVPCWKQRGTILYIEVVYSIYYLSETGNHTLSLLSQLKCQCTTTYGQHCIFEQAEIASLLKIYWMDPFYFCDGASHQRTARVRTTFFWHDDSISSGRWPDKQGSSAKIKVRLTAVRKTVRNRHAVPKIIKNNWPWKIRMKSPHLRFFLC